MTETQDIHRLSTGNERYPQDIHNLSTSEAKVIHRIFNLYPQVVHRIFTMCIQDIHRISTSYVHGYPQGIHDRDHHYRTVLGCLKRPVAEVLSHRDQDTEHGAE